MKDYKSCETCDRPLAQTSEGWYCFACQKTNHQAVDHPSIRISSSVAATSVSTLPPDNPRSASTKVFIQPRIKPTEFQEPQKIKYQKVTTAEMVHRQRQATAQHNRKRALSVAYSAGLVVAIALVMTVASSTAHPKTAYRTAPISTAALHPVQPSIINQNARDRDAIRKTDLADIATALHVYYGSAGHYPVGDDISVLYFLQYSNPSYITHINYDPSSNSKTGKVKKYSYRSDGKHFELSTNLENLADGQSLDGVYRVTD